MATGIVKKYNDSKGFGFIEHENGKDVFVHHSAIHGATFKLLSVGDRVTFDVVQDARGPAEINVNRYNIALLQGGQQGVEVEPKRIVSASTGGIN
jgi:cold shock protein